MLLSVSDNTQAFTVDAKGSIALELKLNVTEYGRPWKHIGDHLYDFGVGRSVLPTLTVEPAQYEFLQRLMSKTGWEVCRGLK